MPALRPLECSNAIGRMLQIERNMHKVTALFIEHFLKSTFNLRDLLSRVTPEPEADYVVSTVHRAKGLEWNRVKVTGDFRFKTEDDGRTTLADDEKRLLYVALTRARHLLDVSELRSDLLKVIRDAEARE